MSKKEKAALNAVNALFSDTSVTRNEAIESLKWLRNEIDLLIDSLRT